MSRGIYRVFAPSGGGLEIELDDLIGVLAQEAEALGRDDEIIARRHLSTVLTQAEAAAPTLERRIGDGRFLAVGALSRLGLGVVLGPLLHVVGGGFALSGATRLLRLDAQLRPHILTVYAQLEGLDRDVFEAVHELQSRDVIVNFDALRSHRPAAAFGHRPPTLTEIVELVGTATDGRVRTAVAIADAANGLAARGIVSTDGTTFAIHF